MAKSKFMKHVYERVEFKDIGEMEDGESVIILDL